MKRKYLLQFILILLGTILYFMANLQRVAVPGAIFDVLQKDLNALPSNITALGAMFMYLYATSQVVMGVLLSRYGGFRVIMAGSIIFALGCIIFPFSHSLWILYLSRGLVGLGSATFYLGMIQEIQKIVQKKNFGQILSVILFVGYLGGIIANAPIVMLVEKAGWRNIFIQMGIFTILIAALFFIFACCVKKQSTNRAIKFSRKTYKKILTNKYTINFYTFACLNYALYFVLQTVIGKKFLEDFAMLSTMQAAVVLSIMGAMYAIAGPLLATISKFMYNRRTLFLKSAAINTLFSMVTILILLLFNIKTPLIVALFITLSFFASMSPLLIPLVYDYSAKGEGGLSVSVMTGIFFYVAALLSNIIGLLLNIFPSHIQNGVLVYSNYSYIAIFGFMAILAIISLKACWKIKDAKSTLRYIQMHKHLGNY